MTNPNPKSPPKYAKKMISMFGDRRLTISEMVEDGFCREFGILESCLRSRLDQMTIAGMLLKKKISKPNGYKISYSVSKKGKQHVQAGEA